MNEYYLILYTGVDEYEAVEGTLEQAIAQAKQDRGYCNYGRTGAFVVKTENMWFIRSDGTEVMLGEPDGLFDKSVIQNAQRIGG